MGKEILTPLGEIQIYIDNIRSDYQVEPYICNVRSVRAKPPEGCYRIIVSAKEWHTIRCVLAFCDAETINYGAGGQRYFCSEFVKDNVVLTIGAGDEIEAFDTNQIQYGMEYVCKAPINKVMFGVAWATDYEGEDDIRTQLATDLY